MEKGRETKEKAGHYTLPLGLQRDPVAARSACKTHLGQVPSLIVLNWLRALGPTTMLDLQMGGRRTGLLAHWWPRKRVWCG